MTLLRLIRYAYREQHNELKLSASTSGVVFGANNWMLNAIYGSFRRIMSSKTLAYESIEL